MSKTSMAYPGLVEEQRRNFAARKKKQPSLPGRITNATTRGIYTGNQDGASRPGSEDFLAIPSRFCDQLRYRDGRVQDL